MGPEERERCSADGRHGAADGRLILAEPADGMPQLARRWVPLVVSATRHSPIPSALVLAIMQTESSFDPRARSKTGACGLMQLIPGAGASAAFTYLTGSHDRVPRTSLFRPHLNIVLGIAYLELLWTRAFSMIPPGVLRAYVCVAAYNGGPNRVGRWLRGVDLPDAGFAGIDGPESVGSAFYVHLPWPETRRFVELVGTRWPQYDRWLASRRSADSGARVSSTP